jgi:hypothetical protein
MSWAGLIVSREKGPMDATTALRPGDQVPHFEVTTLAGELFRYSTIWQHKNLVLVTLAGEPEDSRYVAELSAVDAKLGQLKTVCVVTRDRLMGMSAPGALVADRWGEIAHVAGAARVDGLPPPSELLDWLDFVERRCPECEGEVK